MDSRFGSDSALVSIRPPCGAAPLARREARKVEHEAGTRASAGSRLAPARRAGASKPAAVFRGVVLPASNTVITGWRIARTRNWYFVATHRCAGAREGPEE